MEHKKSWLEVAEENFYTDTQRMYLQMFMEARPITMMKGRSGTRFMIESTGGVFEEMKKPKYKNKFSYSEMYEKVNGHKMGLDCRIISSEGKELQLDRWYRIRDILESKDYNNDSYREVFTWEELQTFHHSNDLSFYTWASTVYGFVSAHDKDTLFMFLTDNCDDICSYDYKTNKEKVLAEFKHYAK